MMRISVFLIVLSSLTALPVWSQNLVSNSGFDTDLTGWTTFTGGTAEWSSRDANGSSASGSVRLVPPTETGSTTTLVEQCVEVQELTDYDFGASHYRGPNDSTSGFMQINWWTEDECQEFLFSETLSFFLGDGEGWQSKMQETTSPAGAMSATVRVRVRRESEGVHAGHWDDVIFVPSAGCLSGAETLCLNDDRFEVTVEWRKPNGETGVGRARTIDGIGDSGLFWFFGKQNLEMLVKVIDGCKSSFNSFWVFFAATTDVEFTLRVYDTDAEIERTYFNPQRHPANAVTDVEAFLTCP